ncbi:LacI family DNA-binding transcriptional regulator [Rathayibacter rathayi]|uniref:LacI family DNA-binding transcriptional regulator n=1 Tax=Rathayibacter rathayi TaxID=33887 RepID=UPI000BD97075|nr:LacI family DNA-binding transcriptional regulator [Rathayibacter rathayi]AZZ50016.1 LacI family DNA-binding transcriptional regulator [Rathayibacter rathayi]MWV75301.1 LacI family DNA-binding transcriptional regulator [Rathayibacter rathayi NCPPB 2980 = VKM Ac-1601]PPF51107.1 LacI family DNA-binding transcriptional regulator [Rathayibacter rathayi]PPG71757.1 LacI family DNA-binding transcriptional regulator [Rathayibacter rathayi]PPG80507.1 LacI family DNA-binding transcriptional regulator 
MTRKAVTMSDVARHIGVSRSAVSFAFNDEKQVSSETRARVLAAASELGYRPNAGARALAGRTTDLFGLVTDIVSTPFAGELIAGAQEWFWEHGKSLIIVGTSTPERPDRKSVEMMLEHRVGGVMIATTYNRAIAIPSELDDIDIALVHCYDEAGRHPSIVPDEHDGGYTATRLMLDRGRRRIALVGIDKHLDAARGRFTGYRQALHEAGIPLDPELVVVGGDNATSGYRATTELLSRTRPDGLFCGNDRIAMGAYDAAREAGLSIPSDLSIVGFDNHEVIADYLRPSLTSIALPFREMGRLGAELLVRGPSDRDLPRQTVRCPPILRNSV